MRQSNLEGLTSLDRRPLSCRCGVLDLEAPEETEVAVLFHDPVRAFFSLMESDDASILARSELQGRKPSDIAAENGCSQTDSVLHHNHAKHFFCCLVVLTLAPVKSE